MGFSLPKHHVLQLWTARPGIHVRYPGTSLTYCSGDMPKKNPAKFRRGQGGHARSLVGPEQCPGRGPGILAF